MRRIGLLLALTACFVFAGTATAAEAPIVTTSVVEETFVNGPLLYFQQCRPELGQYTITLELRTVAHTTASGVDESEPGETGELLPPYHLSFATTGTITAVPQNAGEPVFSGRIGVRQVEHVLTPTQQVISAGGRTTLMGSDGSTVTTRFIFRLTTTPQGDVAVNFGDSGCVE